LADKKHQVTSGVFYSVSEKKEMKEITDTHNQ